MIVHGYLPMSNLLAFAGQTVCQLFKGSVGYSLVWFLTHRTMAGWGDWNLAGKPPGNWADLIVCNSGAACHHAAAPDIFSHAYCMCPMAWIISVLRADPQAGLLLRQQWGVLANMFCLAWWAAWFR